ncbi:hypothetical protein SRB5_45250 [Streptomyces sp. RB5]|uniref:Lipoprotein n=1 Tax=Streptomyces smaragdinus TaxID=2585196 RepID=A0A7K0CLI8_9ACTN|nr:hypothetical protein [Streptomyces smaragdinus]MQY14359.1 hypothetical protein [Streptomyces smaragdinus]
MPASRRKATLRLLTVVALGALALTGCGEKGADDAAAPASVEATATADDGVDPAAADTEAPEEKAPFAGTKQFVTMEKAWTEGGVTKVSVRPAQKQKADGFEAWEIIQGTGEFTTVPLAEDARVLLTVQVRPDSDEAGRGEPVETPQDEFVTDFMGLEERLRENVGFDLSFDGEGRVTKLESLYTP